MRLHKFRGLTSFGEWKYGSLLQSEIDVNELNVCCEIHERFASSFSITRFPVDPKTVCEYTGLKDKNGKEIYEGDWLKTGNGEVFKVFFNQSTACFDIEFVGGDCENLVTENGWDEDLKEYQYEIIGNIYQNPELLTPSLTNT